MPNNRKINFVTLIAGLLMILFSVLNFLMNEDEVSLGIFVFSGIGFILFGLAPRYNEQKASRIKKYARTFFFGAAVILIYWTLFVKFKLFQ